MAPAKKVAKAAASAKRCATKKSPPKRTNFHQKHSEHLSTRQRICLCFFYQLIPEINGPVNAYPRVQALWDVCLKRLNSLGPKKELHQWRRALKDLLYRQRKKMEKWSSLIDFDEQELSEILQEITGDSPLFSPPKWTRRRTPDPTFVLLHDIDPYLSDATSLSDTETESTEFSEIFTDDDEHVTELTTALDDFCMEAQSLTPPSFIEEIVGCLTPQETFFSSPNDQIDIQGISSSRTVSLKRKIETEEANAQNINAYCI